MLWAAECRPGDPACQRSGQRVPGKEGDWKQHSVGYLLADHGKDRPSSPPPPTQITLSKRTGIWERHVGSAWNNCTRKLVLKKKKYFDFWPQGRVRGTKGPFSSIGNLCVFSLSLYTCFHLNGKEISLRGNKKPDHHSLASHPSSACHPLCLSLLPG